MTTLHAATACCAANEASPQLVEQAIRLAMAKAGLTQANGVVLFLNGFGKQHTEPAILAAARTAYCMQVFGAAANGVFTEEGWVIDRPAAAVLVLGGELGLCSINAEPDTESDKLSGKEPRLSCTGRNFFPTEWHSGPPRFGAIFNDPASHESARIWRGGRLADDHRFEIDVSGATPHLALSTGWKAIGQTHIVTQSAGYNIQALDGLPAHSVLRPELPIDILIQPNLPLYAVAAIISPADNGSQKRIERIVPVVSVNTDGSFTLAEQIEPETRLRWAIRQPASTEDDMQQALAAICTDFHTDISPAFALMFSANGRGPYFYGSEDRDLLAFKACFPDVPVLGAYAVAQVAPHPINAISTDSAENHILYNAVVTAIYSGNL